MHIQTPQQWRRRGPEEDGEKIPFGITESSGVQVMREDAPGKHPTLPQPPVHTQVSILLCSHYLGSERLSYCLCHKQVSNRAPMPGTQESLPDPFFIITHTLCT